MSPLTDRLRTEVPELLQPWYADDAAMNGDAKDVARAFSLLQRWGPGVGYFPEPEKSVVICPANRRPQIQEALRQFNFRYAEGTRYVGGYIGSADTRESWLDAQVQAWANGVCKLAQVAVKFPQSAYAGLVHSYQHEWQYLQRVTAGVSNAFAPVEQAIVEEFIPNLLQMTPETSKKFRPLLALPVRHGGLGISDPTATCDDAYTSSVSMVATLVDALETNELFDLTAYRKEAGGARRRAKMDKDHDNAIRKAELLEAFAPDAKRCMERASKTGGWLSLIPNRLNGTTLSADEFVDNVRLRYHLNPHDLAPQCSGCGAAFNVDHALSCKVGGLVTARHNEVAGEWHELCAHAFTSAAVSDEPLIPSSRDRAQLRTAEKGSLVPAATRGDVAFRGFWKRGTSAIFDVQVTDTDAPSYQSTTPEKVLENAARRKKKKHLQPCLDAQRHFTPLVFSVDGLHSEETEAACRRLADLLAAKWKQPYSKLCGYVRSRLSLALVRATALCLRGTRGPRVHRSMQMECGAGIAAYFTK